MLRVHQARRKYSDSPLTLEAPFIDYIQANQTKVHRLSGVDSHLPLMVHLKSLSGGHKDMHANIHYWPSQTAKYSFHSDPQSNQLDSSIQISAQQLTQLATTGQSNVYVAVQSVSQGFYRLSPSQLENNTHRLFLGQTIEGSLAPDQLSTYRLQVWQQEKASRQQVDIQVLMQQGSLDLYVRKCAYGGSSVCGAIS